MTESGLVLKDAAKAKLLTWQRDRRTSHKGKAQQCHPTQPTSWQVFDWQPSDKRADGNSPTAQYAFESLVLNVFAIRTN